MSIEPVLTLQTAIRNRLVNKPEVTALVPPTHIRAGSTRPDKTPCIVIADGNTELHGNDYRAQTAAWVFWTCMFGRWTPGRMHRKRSPPPSMLPCPNIICLPKWRAQEPIAIVSRSRPSGTHATPILNMVIPF